MKDSPEEEAKKRLSRRGRDLGILMTTGRRTKPRRQTEISGPGKQENGWLPYAGWARQTVVCRCQLMGSFVPLYFIGPHFPLGYHEGRSLETVQKSASWVWTTDEACEAKCRALPLTFQPAAFFGDAADSVATCQCRCGCLKLCLLSRLYWEGPTSVIGYPGMTLGLQTPLVSCADGCFGS